MQIFFYRFVDTLFKKNIIKSMKRELLKKWILYAKSDLDAARRLFESPKPNN